LKVEIEAPAPFVRFWFSFAIQMLYGTFSG
jgi:hypothetical protein